MYTSINYFQSVLTEIVSFLIVLMPKCNILDIIQIYFWIECVDEKMQHFKRYAIVEVMLWHHLNVLSKNWCNFTHKYYSTFFQQNATHFANLITLFDRLSIMKFSWTNCLLHKQTVFWINLYHSKKRCLCSSGNTWTKMSFRCTTVITNSWFECAAADIHLCFRLFISLKT